MFPPPLFSCARRLCFSFSRRGSELFFSSLLLCTNVSPHCKRSRSPLSSRGVSSPPFRFFFFFEIPLLWTWFNAFLFFDLCQRRPAQRSPQPRCDRRLDSTCRLKNSFPSRGCGADHRLVFDFFQCCMRFVFSPPPPPDSCPP